MQACHQPISCFDNSEEAIKQKWVGGMCLNIELGLSLLGDFVDTSIPAITN